MAELRRLGGGIKKSSAPIKRLGSSIGKIRREPLAFVAEEPNPLEGVKPGKTPEEKITRELSAFGQAFRDAAKNEAAAMHHALEGYGAEYFVMVFRDADQATAFLRKIEYPDAKAVYVDGTIVAELLKIELPESKVPLPKKLKAHRDPKLAKLTRLR